MHEHGTTQVPRASSVRKLNFLEQTIGAGFRWQETWALDSEKQKAAAKPLHIRLADLLYFVMNWIRLSGMTSLKRRKR